MTASQKHLDDIHEVIYRCSDSYRDGGTRRSRPCVTDALKMIKNTPLHVLETPIVTYRDPDHRQVDTSYTLIHSLANDYLKFPAAVHLRIVKAFLDKGVNVNSPKIRIWPFNSSTTRTTFLYSLCYFHPMETDLVKLVLEHGAKATHEEAIIAVKHDNVRLLDLLLSHGAARSVQQMDTRHIHTDLTLGDPFSYALEIKAKQCIAYLLRSGLLHDKIYPLHAAVHFMHIEATKRLLALGFSPTAPGPATYMYHTPRPPRQIVHAKLTNADVFYADEIPDRDSVLKLRTLERLLNGEAPGRNARLTLHAKHNIHIDPVTQEPVPSRRALYISQNVRKSQIPFVYNRSTVEGMTRTGRTLRSPTNPGIRLTPEDFVPLPKHLHGTYNEMYYSDLERRAHELERHIRETRSRPLRHPLPGKSYSPEQEERLKGMMLEESETHLNRIQSILRKKQRKRSNPIRRLFRR